MFQLSQEAIIMYFSCVKHTQTFNVEIKKKYRTNQYLDLPGFEPGIFSWESDALPPRLPRNFDISPGKLSYLF